MVPSEDPTLPSNPSPREAIPSRIGPYTIKRKIASGGMGTIFEGVQDNPRRPVAIKVMRRGVVTPEALRRFEYESQLLARLRHPGIAQVYEAGRYGEGADALPFFAMEYIPNAKPLTRYAGDKNLDTAQRLELFARICDAVHHGHQKGIVHRDLKPSNILVDSQGNPRIIDFGVARATDSDVALTTFQTEVGQLIGSLQYMSPEQFEADPHDIDTRSDVYSLGAVLYELLRDELPYDLGKTNVYQASRIVREESLPRLGDGRPDLTGDVETIVHKAMDKDRDRRYQSAFGLAQDIRRHLKGETILARPPSMSYQLRVFARKNKVLIGAVAVVFAVLVAGVAVSTSLFLRAERQRERAEAQTAKARVANDFLTEMIKEAIPVGYGEEATISDMLDLSRERAPVAFNDEPEVEAEVCRALGFGYLYLTQPEDAQKLLRRAYELRKQALGTDDPTTMESLADLAFILGIVGYNEELVAVRRMILDLRTQMLGGEHELTLQATYDLATALATLGHMGESEELIAVHNETCRRVLGERHPMTLEAEIFHAGLQLLRGDVAEAEARGRDLLIRCREEFGDEHEVTRAARSHLAAALVIQSRFDDASEIYNHRRLPDELGIQASFQGEFERDHEGARIIVFWETWCPFSQRAVPRLEDLYQRYRPQNLDVVGVTMVSRTATPETVRDFIRDRGISFPVVKSDGRLNRYFNQIGTPFVTVLNDGEMVWESYMDTPEKVPAILIEGLVATKPGTE